MYLSGKIAFFCCSTFTSSISILFRFWWNLISNQSNNYPSLKSIKRSVYFWLFQPTFRLKFTELLIDNVNDYREQSSKSIRLKQILPIFSVFWTILAILVLFKFQKNVTLNNETQKFFASKLAPRDRHVQNWSFFLKKYCFRNSNVYW